jgi:uncharacterized protein YecE (DUF72 family)
VDGRAVHLLSSYATHFKAVEINTTFYGIPSIDTVRAWADATPPDFRFCVKMPRDVTHGPTPRGALAASDGPPPGHLLHKETHATVQRFAEVIQPLGNKLGAVLVQFPPKFVAGRFDELAAVFDRFERATPIAVEFRHDSWWTSETAAFLRDRGICWVGTDESSQREAMRVPDSGDRGMSAIRSITPTTDFLYVRWLGKHGQFKDRSQEHFDPSLRLRWWVERLRAILTANPHIRSVYGFFDNDFAGYAPATAMRFMSMLGIASHDAGGPQLDEPTLFG